MNVCEGVYMAYVWYKYVLHILVYVHECVHICVDMEARS